MLKTGRKGVSRGIAVWCALALLATVVVSGGPGTAGAAVSNDGLMGLPDQELVSSVAAGSQVGAGGFNMSIDEQYGSIRAGGVDLALQGRSGIDLVIGRVWQPAQAVWTTECDNGLDDDGDGPADTADGDCEDGNDAGEAEEGAQSTPFWRRQSVGEPLGSGWSLLTSLGELRHRFGGTKEVDGLSADSADEYIEYWYLRPDGVPERVLLFRRKTVKPCVRLLPEGNCVTTVNAGTGSSTTQSSYLSASGWAAEEEVERTVEGETVTKVRRVALSRPDRSTVHCFAKAAGSLGAEKLLPTVSWCDAVGSSNPGPAMEAEYDQSSGTPRIESVTDVFGRKVIFGRDGDNRVDGFTIEGDDSEYPFRVSYGFGAGDCWSSGKCLTSVGYGPAGSERTWRFAYGDPGAATSDPYSGADKSVGAPGHQLTKVTSPEQATTEIAYGWRSLHTQVAPDTKYLNPHSGAWEWGVGVAKVPAVIELKTSGSGVPTRSEQLSWSSAEVQERQSSAWTLLSEKGWWTQPVPAGIQVVTDTDGSTAALLTMASSSGSSYGTPYAAVPFGAPMRRLTKSASTSAVTETTFDTYSPFTLPTTNSYGFVTQRFQPWVLRQTETTSWADRTTTVVTERTEPAQLVCDNGIDDDGDGKVDWDNDPTGSTTADPDCWGPNDVQEATSTDGVPFQPYPKGLPPTVTVTESTTADGVTDPARVSTTTFEIPLALASDMVEGGPIPIVDRFAYPTTTTTTVAGNKGLGSHVTLNCWGQPIDVYETASDGATGRHLRRYVYRQSDELCGGTRGELYEIREKTSAGDRVTRIETDPSFRTEGGIKVRSVAVTTAAGTEAEHRTVTTYDVLDRPRTVVDVTTNTTATFSYEEAYGRLTLADQPSDGLPDLGLNYPSAGQVDVSVAGTPQATITTDAVARATKVVATTGESVETKLLDAAGGSLATETVEKSSSGEKSRTTITDRYARADTTAAVDGTVLSDTDYDSNGRVDHLSALHGYADFEYPSARETNIDTGPRIAGSGGVPTDGPANKSETRTGEFVGIQERTKERRFSAGVNSYTAASTSDARVVRYGYNDIFDAAESVHVFSVDSAGVETAIGELDRTVTYDIWGRPQIQRSGPSRSTTYYNVDGSVSARTNENAQGAIETSFAYTYDVLGRPDHVTDTTDDPDLLLFDYDHDETSRTTTLRDTSHTGEAADSYTTVRDSSGRVVSERWESGEVGDTFTTATGYDALGRISDVSVSSLNDPETDASIGFGYERGRLHQVSAGDTLVVSDIAYRADGQLTETAYREGLVDRYQRDTGGRLERHWATATDSTTIADLTYAYTDTGQIDRITDGIADGDVADRLFAYDTATGAALTEAFRQADGTILATDYRYGPSGDMTCRAVSTVTDEAAAGDAREPANRVSTNKNATRFRYQSGQLVGIDSYSGEDCTAEATGTPTQVGIETGSPTGYPGADAAGNVYLNDHLGRLRTITRPTGEIHRFRYRPDGTRNLEISPDGTKTVILRDPAGVPIVESVLSPDGSRTARIDIQGPTGRVATLTVGDDPDATGTPEATINDHTNSPFHVSYLDGTLGTTRYWDVYGRERVPTPLSVPAITNAFRTLGFASWRVDDLGDGSEGLLDAPHRTYNSDNGRFLQPDPVTTDDPDDLNAYTLNRGDPVNIVDPLGLTEQPGPNAEQTSPPGEALPTLADAGTTAGMIGGGLLDGYGGVTDLLALPWSALGYEPTDIGYPGALRGYSQFVAGNGAWAVGKELGAAAGLALGFAGVLKGGIQLGRGLRSLLGSRSVRFGTWSGNAEIVSLSPESRTMQKSWAKWAEKALPASWHAAFEHGVPPDFVANPAISRLVRQVLHRAEREIPQDAGVIVAVICYGSRNNMAKSVSLLRPNSVVVAFPDGIEFFQTTRFSRGVLAYHLPGKSGSFKPFDVVPTDTWEAVMSRHPELTFYRGGIVIPRAGANGP